MSTALKTIVLYLKTLKNFQQKFIYFLKYRHYRVAGIVLAKTIVAKTGNPQNEHKIQNISRTTQSIITRSWVLATLADSQSNIKLRLSPKVTGLVGIGKMTCVLCLLLRRLGAYFQIKTKSQLLNGFLYTFVAGVTPLVAFFACHVGTIFAVVTSDLAVVTVVVIVVFVVIHFATVMKRCQLEPWLGKRLTS